LFRPGPPWGWFRCRCSGRRARPLRHGGRRRHLSLAKVYFSGNADLVIVAFAIGMGIIPIASPNPRIRSAPAPDPARL
jgi:hypothetical protein